MCHELFSLQLGSSQATSLKTKTALSSVMVASLSLLGLCLFQLYNQSTLPSWALLLSLMLTLLILISYAKFRLHAALTLLPPICIFLLCWDIITHHNQSINPTQLHILGKAHIILAATGQATSIFSCIISVLFLWKQYHLKHKQLTSALASTTPSLQKLSTMLSVSLYVGLISFSLALITGVVFALTSTYSIPFLKTKIMWAMGVWGYYICLIVLKEKLGIDFKRLSQLCLYGFLWFTLVFFAILIWF